MNSVFILETKDFCSREKFEIAGGSEETAQSSGNSAVAQALYSSGRRELQQVWSRAGMPCGMWPHMVASWSS